MINYFKKLVGISKKSQGSPVEIEKIISATDAKKKTDELNVPFTVKIDVINSYIRTAILDGEYQTLFCIDSYEVESVNQVIKTLLENGYKVEVKDGILYISWS